MRKPETKSKSAPTTTPALVAARSRFPVWLMPALLTLVTIVLYWPATRCDFVNYDDSLYVTENPHVESGLTWAGVKWAFCNTERAAYWAPMMWLSHQLACQLFGLNPWGHHLINILLHAVNTALVFVLLRSLTGATWRSFFVAALFGLHPLRVESVAWITERKDVLSTCFGLLTLLLYARYADQSKVQSPKSKVFYWLALVFFALGLMSKPMLVTWPFVMLLLDYWPLGRVAGDGWQVTSDKNSGSQPRGATTCRVETERRRERSEGGSTFNHLLFEKWPFFGLAAVMSVVTFMAQKHDGSVISVKTLSLGARGGNALISYCRYLEKLFWPVDLAVFYPHPGHWPMEKVLLAGGFILGITVLLIMQRRRYPFLPMGWLWYVGTLVPMIGLVQAGRVAMADRFTYVPSLGVLILAIWGVNELACRWRHRVIVLSVAGCVASILCLGMTRQQLGYWRDSETLFQHAIEVTEDNYIASNGLGLALDKKGQPDEAINQYQEAIRLKPDFAEAHNNLGAVLDEIGHTDEAVNQIQEAIRLKPDYANAHHNLGIALLKQDRIDEAINQFQEVIRLKPDNAEAHNYLGNALGRKAQIVEAINQFQEAIHLQPDYAEAHNNLGIALFNNDQVDEAISQYRQAIRLQPGLAKAHHNLGTVLLKKGRTDEAISEFRETIRLQPDYAEAHNNLGTALGKKGQIDEAISQYQEAVRLKPGLAEARDNLARALEIKNVPAGR
jgi:tetratricopeptide (TPR) repeat protein